MLRSAPPGRVSKDAHRDAPQCSRKPLQPLTRQGVARSKTDRRGIDEPSDHLDGRAVFSASSSILSRRPTSNSCAMVNTMCDRAAD
jgi:hypothetical protein